jgi:opacity protein-like surface antigen
MKKLLGVVMILCIAGSSAAADYWHLGIGFSGSEVVLRGNHKNTQGFRILASLGDPDSRFTTQLEVERWESVYDLHGLENRYSGFGAGFYEKFRLLNFSTAISTYLIGGVGGYFLDYKKQEEVENVGLDLRSQYLNSLWTTAGGLGLDFRFGQHIILFTEGRYVTFPGGSDEDDPFTTGYLGIRYQF